jgi:hypothetical protein
MVLRVLGWGGVRELAGDGGQGGLDGGQGQQWGWIEDGGAAKWRSRRRREAAVGGLAGGGGRGVGRRKKMVARVGRGPQID